MSNKKLEIKDRYGNITSFKEFRVANKESLLEHAIPQGQLIADSIFTQSEINELVCQGKLHKILLANKTYFDKKEIIDCYKQLKINL